jgi:hypothetical protein
MTTLFLKLALAYIIPGFIFTFSRAEHHTAKNVGTATSKLNLAGLYIIVLAAVYGFVTQIISLQDYQYGTVSTIIGALLGSSTFILIAVAVWKKSLRGSIIGACYSLLMIVYFLMLQVANRTVMLSQIKYEIIPTVLLLIGSITVLTSFAPKLKAEPAAA